MHACQHDFLIFFVLVRTNFKPVHFNCKLILCVQAWQSNATAHRRGLILFNFWTWIQHFNHQRSLVYHITYHISNSVFFSRFFNVTSSLFIYESSDIWHHIIPYLWSNAFIPLICLQDSGILWLENSFGYFILWEKVGNRYIYFLLFPTI